jgi:hypothetical protein
MRDKSLKRLAEAHARTVDEIREEIAGSLGRKGAELEKLLGERAQLCLWQLQVQREAIGLRRHEELFALYPLPSRMA